MSTMHESLSCLLLPHRVQRPWMESTPHSIQTDFAFLSTKGEVVADELPGSVKILVLVEMMSRRGMWSLGKTLKLPVGRLVVTTFWFDVQGCFHGCSY